MPVAPSGESAQEWVLANIPIIAFYSTWRVPKPDFIVDDEARRVCTYLRAFDNGTINRKFEGAVKRIVLVLDCSGSMNGTPFQDAVRNAVSIFDSHVVEGDEFGVVLFDDNVHIPIPIQTIGTNKLRLRSMVQRLPYYGGGTSMYRALSYMLHTLSSRDERIESWVVCLTDGVSDNIDFTSFCQQLRASSPELHVVSVGINLDASYEQNLRELSQKYGIGDPKGFFVRSDGTTAGMDSAFDVVKSRIPVSQTFEMDGILSDDDCRHYMAQYLPSFVDANDMILQSFWIRFLYRRVKVFDDNNAFNYNEKHDALGSSLMEVMLSEVERLLGENLRRDWLDTNHAQLIYDFASQAPEFRLICTAPEGLEAELREKLSSLDLPGFRIPTRSDLDQRGSLDRFLSQALDIPLQANDDGSEVLQCIDENGFILTLDFTMKLLSIHERVACRIPCLIEGETGVSKSALTKMYSILRNSSLAAKSRARTIEDLDGVAKQLEKDGFDIPSCGFTSTQERLREIILNDTGGNDEVLRVLELLQEKMENRPSIFATCTEAQEGRLETTVERALFALEFFSQSRLEKTFFDINVDASLTEQVFVDMFREISEVARKLLHCDATVVVFLDEINTSSVLGLLKEVVIDHSIAGNALEENIVVVAALNPSRAEIETHGRERDLSHQWASGHYQVAALPESMKKLKWSYGSLTHGQEKDFIFRRIEALHDSAMPAILRVALTEVVSESHEIMRRFAQRNIVESIRRARQESSADIDEIYSEAQERARSIVSLRDIQRVFSLFEFFFEDLKDTSMAMNWSESETQRRAMILAVATVYYFRLDGRSRDEFVAMLQSLPTEAGRKPSFLEILDDAMNSVVSESEVPSGIAVTRGLKENIFVTLVCSLSQTPLIIVGPPGSSKTLSVNVVDSNANGSDSLSKFYRKRPRLSLFHYQCSKQSTSREIAAVFAQAIQRQERVDATKHRCVVFMDEAGLPESERESLKVLHYLLEGHMSAKAKVGFVAISNHVLDAAKSNRCVMLLRQEPDEEEMQNITMGVLFDVRDDGSYAVHDVEMGGALLSAREFATKLCMSYASLFEDRSRLSHLITFFGLRDYIYFLKALRFGSRTEMTRLLTSVQTIIAALERNFNGITAQEFRQLTASFLEPFAKLPLQLSDESIEEIFRHPMAVLKDALTEPSSSVSESHRFRFKLIIDCTDDDSILRLLSKGDVAEVSKRSLYKLSNLPDNVELEQLRLISGVKFAALQGSFAVLSQTEPINESFYDLFNQRFREVTGRDGKVTLYANIAVGGISRRSLVRPDFQCVVHVRASNMDEIPAPFLNRFEKYRLTLADVLTAGWSRFGSMSEIIAQAQKKTSDLAAVLGGRSDTFGWIESPETLNSLFVDLLPHLDKRIWDEKGETVQEFSSDSRTFEEILCDFIQHFTSLSNASEHICHTIRMAKDVLPVDVADSLDQLVSKQTNLSKLQDSLRSIGNGASTNQPASGLVSMLIQMVITRATGFRLIQLATPEAIFASRHNLPHDVLNEYFRQEHFSLKRLLVHLLSTSVQSASVSVVHTRTDQFVHAIPTLPADRGLSSEDSETVETVIKLVHEQGPYGLVIENLSSLRSEASVRSAIHTWAQHESRHVFLMLVDMSNRHSLDRTNFVRMVVEQNISESSGKTFALLLHYSPSSTHQSHCYPALFLGGWQHVFLDSVGNDSTAFSVDRFVALACKDTSNADGLEPSRQRVRQSIQGLLPRVLPYLANQTLFYREQDMNMNGSFCHRKTLLDRLMNSTVGEDTIGDILCEKFSAIWLDNALFSTTRNASEALLLGTTQLSLSMSIHSVLIQSFQVFLGAALADANQWMNLDLIDIPSSNPGLLELFGLCLQGLPVMPFEELVLQRKRGKFSRLRAFPSSRHPAARPQFPFFNFVSEYLDELVEAVVERHVRAASSEESVMVKKLSIGECLSAVIDKIEQESDEAKMSAALHQERGRLAKSIVGFVSESSHESSDDISLFERYVRQFVEWKIGCRLGSFISKWLKCRLDGIHAWGSIVAVHVIARLEQMDLMKVASIVSLAESLHVEAEVFLVEMEDTTDLFSFIFDMLEGAVRDRKPLNSTKWSLPIASVLRRTYATLSGSSFDDEESAYRLRRIILLLLCDKLGFAPSTENSLSLWAKDMTLVSKEDYSLSSILEAMDVDTLSGSHAAEVLLQHFLSPSWLLTTTVFRLDDLSYLLRYIEEGGFSGRGHQTAVSLLRSACSCDGGQAYGLSLEVLLIINGRLSCDNLAIFSSDSERRNCIPHFVPSWLRKHLAAVEQDVSTCCTFFAQYKHCFDGSLSTIVFDLFLSVFAHEAESFTSEQLFLLLQREMDSELSLNRQTHTQLSRLRAVGTEESLCGTPLASIALSARLICFVAKLAQEVATEMHAVVLSGTYSRDAYAFINELMVLKQASFQSFFMASIIRMRGEGTLSTALAPGGPLGDLGWCREWDEAGAHDEVIELLHQTETALAEAVAEEERKSRELRLCPHCQQPFIVAEANCGQFTCGRDAHQLNGRPALNNTVINDTHGCGRAFNLAHAPQYRTDETILAPLRGRIAELQLRLNRCQRAATLWDGARSLDVPPLVYLVKAECPHGSLLPSSQLLSANATSEEEHLFLVLWESTGLLPYLQLLPDLIELYIWLHDTFRFLVTREDAFRIVMKDLMTKENLRKRFDMARVQHLLRLWERCRVGLNEILARTDHVHWECETVLIPFEKLENARLASLLSEGQFPTDGNDFLFLLINETVGKYNVFAEKLAVFATSASEAEAHKAIPPKYIVRGLAGALRIGAILPLTRKELNWMAESCWNSEQKVYDSNRLRLVLQNAVHLHDPPSMIADPLHHLRELFCFRDDNGPEISDSHANVTIVKHNGLYFANRQDAELVDEVQHYLTLLEIPVGAQDIRRTFIDNLHGMDYDSVRALLEGSRSLFDLLLSNGKDTFATMEATLDELVKAGNASRQTSLPLQALGFPKMSEKQSRLLLSLDVFQTVELVNFAAYELASEAYLFSGLPLYMTDPLNEDLERGIKEGIESLCSSGRSIKEVVQHINEFVRDILSFYESQIVEGAAQTNSSLRAFLLQSNFCDSSDPVFAVIPSTVLLRHYVSLRQLLHQVKLSWMFCLTSTESDTGMVSANRNESLSATTRGRCWLWEGDESTSMNVDPTTGEQTIPSKLHRDLWFQQALSAGETSLPEGIFDEEKMDEETERSAEQRRVPKDKECQIDHILLDEEQDADDVKCKAAILLQGWWRRQMELLADMELSCDESSVQLADEVVEQVYKAESSSDFEMLEQSSSDGHDVSSEPDWNNRIEISYGRPEDERSMRVWLDSNSLPQTTADILLQQGARSREDVCMLVQECPELLDLFPPLDRVKLRKIVAMAASSM